MASLELRSFKTPPIIDELENGNEMLSEESSLTGNPRTRKSTFAPTAG